MLLFLLPLAVFSQQLYSPFLPGETWQCAQGNNGSFTHKGTTGKYGLYYSWDFSLSGLPGDLCRPVLASATGIVKNIAFDGSLGSHYGGGSAECEGKGTGYGFTVQIFTTAGKYLRTSHHHYNSTTGTPYFFVRDGELV